VRVNGLSDTDITKRIGLFLYIVTLRLKAGIVEPQETSTVKQRLGKYVHAAINTQETIEVLLETMFPVSETLCFVVFRIPDERQSPKTL
jgi:hypothetical protein